MKPKFIQKMNLTKKMKVFYFLYKIYNHENRVSKIKSFINETNKFKSL